MTANIKINKIAMTTGTIQALLLKLGVTEKMKTGSLLAIISGGISAQGHRYSLTVNSLKQLLIIHSIHYRI